MRVSLKEFYQDNRNSEDMQKLYYNMSTTAKYIHDCNHCINSFNLKDIEVLDKEKLTPIQFNHIARMSPLDEEQFVREDIYHLAFMQIGIYSNTLDHLKPQFLKENFELFAQFLPEEDVPYFKGVIERGASVYYCDFVVERSRREIEVLKKEVGEEETSNALGFQKSKKTAIGSAYADRETRDLYSGLDDKRQAAFTSFMILPFVMVLLGVILSIMLYLD